MLAFQHCVHTLHACTVMCSIESMRPSVFFYPTDKLVEGSVRTYRGLLDRCLARSMAIICEVVVSERFSPRHVALIPQAERKDEEGTIVVPGGFFGVILPFADDIRHISVATPPDQPPGVRNTCMRARARAHRTHASLAFFMPACSACVCSG